MEPIKLYFAGTWGIKLKSGLGDCGITNRLVSFHYPDQFFQWMKISGDKPGCMILDSGAFSSWNKGSVINLDDYIAYIHKVTEIAKTNNKEMHVVNLDVIPGKSGQTKELNAFLRHSDVIDKNKQLIEDSALQGFQNLKILKSNGITPIHVFHQGETWKWLDRMLKYTDYIGISPANDMSSTSKKRWMESVFEYLYRNGIHCRTHGFAVMLPSILKDYPWTSADAASWGIQAAMGHIAIPYHNKQFINGQFFTVESVSAKKTHRLKKSIINHIEAEGHTVEQVQNNHEIRRIMNIKAYLEYETALNAYKGKHEYKPKMTPLL